MKMFNFFESKKTLPTHAPTPAPDPAPAKPYSTKTTNELVEEIHQSFFISLDKEIVSTKKDIEHYKTLEHKLEKAKRLDNIYFSHSVEVTEFKDISEKKDKANEFLRAVEYFNQKYPLHKLITRKGIEAICEKYGLLYGSCYKYIGTVPEKNLKEIEDFLKIIDKVDRPFYYPSLYGWYSYDALKKKLGDDIDWSLAEGRCFFIAAPSAQMNTDNSRIENFQIIPDPVVFCPVLFSENEYYLIVTAWGLEASDELVVNHKFN